MLQVLDSDPSTERDTWSSMIQLWRHRRDVIRVHPLGSIQLCLETQETAGTTLSMQTWRLKISEGPWLLGFLLRGVGGNYSNVCGKNTFPRVTLLFPVARSI